LKDSGKGALFKKGLELNLPEDKDIIPSKRKQIMFAEITDDK
jgi:hypothetical protein